MSSSLSLSILLCSCLLLVVVVSSSSFASAQGDLIPTSHPDIYPDEDLGPFVGMVEVTITPNAPNCDIHYELNTSQTGTSREPDEPDKLLSAARSPLYSGRYPLQITRVGRTKVTAVCIPTIANDFHGKSKPTIHYYTVLPTDVDPPIAQPPSGEYVASSDLIVRLHEPLSVGTDPEHVRNNAKCDIMYSIDDPNPGEQWVELSPGGGIELTDQIGHHVIYAKCVLRTQADANHKNNGKSSAVVRYTYDIRPPLTYDVGSECSKCGYKPMHGAYFTVVLQGADKGDAFFLTTSSQGCATQHHVLDNTPDRVVLHDMRRAFKFWGSEPDVHVYVCLRKKNSPSFTLVPRRRSKSDSQRQSSNSNNKNDENFFVIEKSSFMSGDQISGPPQEFTRAPAPDKETINKKNVVSPTSSTNIFAILIGFLLILGSICVWKIVRIMMKLDKHNQKGFLGMKFGGGKKKKPVEDEGEGMVAKK